IETKAPERYRGAFKTSTLRELTRTAPYFHDGHALDLAAVVDFYDAGGVRTDSGYLLNEAGHDGVAEETNRRLGLTQAEKNDLILYLQSLSADTNGSSNGPSGWNGQPVVTVVYPTTPPPWFVPVGGSPAMTVDVTDPTDGQADLDPTMLWTLQVDGGATQ